MKKLNTNSGKQIICGLVTLVIITLGMGIHTIREMNGLSAITAQMYHHPLTVGNAVRDIRSDIIAMHRSMKDVTLAQNADQFTRAIEEVNRLEQRVFTNFDLIEERFLGDINDVQQANEAFSDWKCIRDEVIDLCEDQKFQQAALITTGKGAAHVEQMEAKIQLMIDFANKKGTEFFAKSTSDSKKNLITTYILLLGALFTGIVVAIFITRIWRETEQINTEEDWLKTGTNELNIAMRGNQDQESLTIHIITFLARYMNAHIGALYIVDNKTQNLHFAGGYGLATSPIPEISAGQGLSGEVLRSGQRILTEQIPEGYFNIQSATGKASAQQLIIIPFSHDSKVVGIIELGRFTPYTETQLNFLDSAMPAIATTLIASTSRLQLSTLLAESRYRTKQLEQQEQKLTMANNILGEKSIELSRQHAEIEQQNMELLTARTELEIRADELARASKYKSEFLANMSHELRTPLNSLLILSESLHQNTAHNLSPEEVQSARVINEAGHDLLTLINEILDLAKIEAGRTEIRITAVIVDSLMDNIHSMFTPLAKEKDLEFTIQPCSETPVTIQTDQFRLNQILKNLIGNAIKFTQTGFVTVTTEIPQQDLIINRRKFPHDNCIVIKVSDSGIGIDTTQQQAIFEPFQQADGTTARQYGGTGLGLSISRKLAHLLGGEIEVKSGSGKGATFSLYLPIDSPAQAVKQNRDQAQKKVATTSTPRSPFNAANILIIEDDPELGQKLINKTQELKLHATLSTSYTEGLNLAKTRQPQAIIIDQHTSPENGSEILKEITNGHPVPIHIFTRDQEITAINSDICSFLKLHSLMDEPIDYELDKVRVLLVDDDMRNIFALATILEQKGMIVEMADNGQRALDKLKDAANFDIILMDIMMPEMDGYAAMAEIRKKESCATLPIIAITAKAMTKDRQKCFHAGATDFLAKPIEIPELIKKIAGALHRK